MNNTNGILFQHINPKINKFFGQSNRDELNCLFQFLEDVSGKNLFLKNNPHPFAGNVLLKGMHKY